MAIGDRVVRFVSRLKQCGDLSNAFPSGWGVEVVAGSIAGDSFGFTEPTVGRWRNWTVCGRS
ncbi:MAG: hypothetical protein U5K28_04855 [Halobacteriales archaeon]|nr:hypothetical protein [Halobacteriales archaeon]